MALDAKLQAITLRIDTATLPGATTDRLPTDRNFPAIRTIHYTFAHLPDAAIRIRRDARRQRPTIATQSTIAIIQRKTTTAVVPGIALATHLASHIAQVAARLIADGTGSEQRDQQSKGE